ncbi:hypothetical protein AGR4B_pAt20026 [Agrobacterium tumefaciens str. CFBP 5621]|nr:hypothetical protein AGR4B_pAt20026 [Agrobacterium tumefaciens str. CFBP 5621]
MVLTPFNVRFVRLKPLALLGVGTSRLLVKPTGPLRLLKLPSRQSGGSNGMVSSKVERLSQFSCSGKLTS